MQDITTKLSRVATAAKAAGLTTDQTRHLIHGTGGSPRRAKRAIRLGIHDQLIAAYTAALAETGAHATAVIACNKLWAELVPSAPAAAEPDDTDGADADEAGDEADAAVAAAAASASRKATKVRRNIAERIATDAGLVPAAKPAPKRIRRMGAAPSMLPSVDDLKALLPATV